MTEIQEQEIRSGETLLQHLERTGHPDPFHNEVYGILKKLEVRSAAIPDVVPVKAGRIGLTCENCGLPSDVIAPKGYVFDLETRPDNKYQHRSTKHKVWCCSEECTVQSLARNKYGEASHKWPVTLAEFRQIEGEPFVRGLKGSDRYEMPLQVAENTEPKMGLNEEMTLPPTGVNFVTRGRPKTHSTAAARQRAYRDRQRAVAVQP